MQVIARALDVLVLVGRSSGGMLLSEISQELDLPPSTAHRLLKVLLQNGFLSRDDDSRRYVAGFRLLELAGAIHTTGSVAEVAQPHLDRLRDRFGETAFAAELVGGRAVCVALAEGPAPLRLTVGIGQELPLHAAASARVLLAYTSDGEARGLLERHAMQQFTEATPRTTDSVLAHLARIRSDGYGVCENEFDENVYAVAAPVRTPEGRARASVTLAGPAGRCAGAALRAEIAAAVCEAAALVEAELDGGISPVRAAWDGVAGTAGVRNAVVPTGQRP